MCKICTTLSGKSKTMCEYKIEFDKMGTHAFYVFVQPIADIEDGHTFESRRFNIPVKYCPNCGRKLINEKL